MKPTDFRRLFNKATKTAEWNRVGRKWELNHPLKIKTINNQIEIIGVESSKCHYKRPRMPACDGGGLSQSNAVKQAGQVANLYSVATLS